MPQKISETIVRKCKRCGCEFHPTARKQFYCNQIKVSFCCVCGKQFEYKCCSEIPKKTCSPQCAKIYSNKKASLPKRKCKWCGNWFIPKTSRDLYCSEKHYKTCEVCGKEFEIDVRKDRERKTCSAECKKKLQLKHRNLEEERKHYLETMRQTYGVDNPMELQSSKDRMQSTNHSKYGADWFTQTDEYKRKVKETSLANYGHEHFLSCPDVIEKRQSTCLDKYGVDNVAKSDEVKLRIKDSLHSKYGIDNPSQLNIKDMELWNRFKQDPKSFILHQFDHKPTIIELSEYLGVCITSIYNNINLNEVKDILSKQYSTMEKEIIDFIKKLDSSITIITHDRKQINPYELDIYLPDYKLAIECNPTWTHNSSISDPWGNAPKTYNYHQMKTEMCENSGIQLIHIFGYEWEWKKDIIESMIRNKLRKNSIRIYSRKCDIREVSYKDSCSFLDVNHRQGRCVSKVNLGLYFEDKLVSLMTFGKPRVNMKASNQCEWELIRFCNKLNTSVIGAASKLFKHFLLLYVNSGEQILSYSDRAHTSGGLYNILGFDFISFSDPGYVWVDIKNDRAYNRFNFQKDKIKDFLKDEDIDISSTESQICLNHNLVKVFDSGTAVWIYIKQ